MKLATVAQNSGNKLLIAAVFYFNTPHSQLITSLIWTIHSLFSSSQYSFRASYNSMLSERLQMKIKERCYRKALCSYHKAASFLA